jgi:subtilisin family serine protease
VLDRTGSGTFSSIIAGIDRMMKWKTQNPSVQNRVVANFSLGAFTSTSSYNVLDNAIVNAINTGITCVVAAGNSGDNAILFSPAHVTEAITVGAYDIMNRMPSWSNYGSVVDVLAPGVNILTTYLRKKTAVVSGTSFSAPHVSGAAALFLAQNPTALPSVVETNLKQLANDTDGGNNPDIIVPYPGTTLRSIYVKP